MIHYTPAHRLRACSLEAAKVATALERDLSNNPPSSLSTRQRATVRILSYWEEAHLWTNAYLRRLREG